MKGSGEVRELNLKRQSSLRDSESEEVIAFEEITYIAS